MSERAGEGLLSIHTLITRDLTDNLGVCPDLELNCWPFGAQDDTQATEPHQPGLESVLFLKILI